MKKTLYEKDLAANKIRVTREFAAPVEQVWEAWTKPELLEQWWAPKPWKAVSKSMDFREGGRWLYCMTGPEGEKHWSIATYEKIIPNKHYEGLDAFCDEDGNINPEMPRMQWSVDFNAVPDGTRVDVEITFSSREDLEKIVEMGFEEGFAAAHGNLDEILQTTK